MSRLTVASCFEIRASSACSVRFCLRLAPLMSSMWLEHLLERAEPLQQVGGGLVADPRDAGDVVAGVALQPDEVRDELRRDPVAVDHAVAVVHLGVGDPARGGHDPHPVADQLVGVAVSGHDHHRDRRFRAARAGDDRRDHVVGLVALDRKVLIAERGHQRLERRPLLLEQVGAGAALGLVLGIDLLAPGIALVPHHHGRLGAVVGEDLDQHRGEPEDRIGRHPGGGRDRLGQREERAVGEAVAVDQEELVGHLILNLASARTVCGRPAARARAVPATCRTRQIPPPRGRLAVWCMHTVLDAAGLTESCGFVVKCTPAPAAVADPGRSSPEESVASRRDEHRRGTRARAARGCFKEWGWRGFGIPGGDPAATPGEARRAARTRGRALPGPLRPRRHRRRSCSERVRRPRPPAPTPASVVRLAGRMLGERRHGGLDFADLRDETGAIQLLVTRDEVGDRRLHDFSDLDLGDWIGVEGTVDGLRPRRAVGPGRERSSCSPRACGRCPTSATALADPEARYRRRYLDLIARRVDSRRTFAIRSAVIAPPAGC